MGIYNKQTVGIFSREGQEQYQWLTTLLLSLQFRAIVKDVRPVLITNAACGRSRRFREEIAQCSFAILYHSQTRGRLNITNVTDSLYDEELRDLSGALGRQKVLVLVDDVENHDQTVQDRIGLEQPLIRELAGLLVVFYKNEKPVYSGGAELYTNGADSYQRNADNKTKRKIESIRSQMLNARTKNKMCLVFMIFVGVLLFIMIIVLCVELIR